MLGIRSIRRRVSHHASAVASPRATYPGGGVAVHQQLY